MIYRSTKYLFVVIGVVLMVVSFCACTSSSPESTPAKEEYSLTLKGWQDALNDDARANNNVKAQEFIQQYVETNGEQLDKLIESLSVCEQLQGTDGDHYGFYRMPDGQNAGISFTHDNSMGASYNDEGAILVEIKKDSALYESIEKIMSDGLFERILITRNAEHSKITFYIFSSIGSVAISLFKIEGGETAVNKYIDNFNAHIYNDEDKLFNIKNNWYLQYWWYGTGVGSL